MSLDVNRLTLDEKISNLEKTKQTRSIQSSFIDFDQYPDNYIDFSSENFICKISIDNAGDYYPPWDGFGFKICLFSPRINGFLFRNLELLTQVTISKVVTFNKFGNDPNNYLLSIYFRDLFRNSFSIFKKEHMFKLSSLVQFENSSDYIGFLMPMFFKLPFPTKVFADSSGSKKVYIGREFSLNPIDGTFTVASVYGDGPLSGSPTVYPSVGYSRLSIASLPYNFSMFIPSRTYFNSTYHTVVTVPSVGDLEERFKPLFPASWSV